MAKKLGAYLCSGCGIGDAVDVDKLGALAAQSGGLVRRSPAFCLEDARLIAADVEGGVDSVVVAACSGRVNHDVFRFPGAFVERVNLREQVAWSHEPRHPETQALAEDALRMGLVRGQKAAAPSPYTEANERAVLVVGGGLSGLTAALSAARSGVSVVLVEQAGVLGGHAARLHRGFPSRPPWTDLEACDVETTIREVREHRAIGVMLESRVASITGQPGRFVATLAGASGVTTELTVGAIVLATGWRPAPTDKYARYGLGRHPNVVTSLDLEAMAARGPIVRPSDGRPAARVAFLLCDGHDDDGHLPYGGNVTSLVALKQALYVRRQGEATAFIFYGDMQTPGQHERFYRRVQQDPGVMLSQGQVRALTAEPDGSLSLEVADTLLGGDVRLVVDLVVLATGMEPAAEGALGLRYLQGEGVPTTAFGFADSHFVCFPYETRRTGIYAAGGVRQAMDLATARRDGRAAALKAIQSIEQSSAGRAVHPRSGDLSYPGFFMQNCTSCGRCTQECPFGALELDDKKHPVLETNRCRRCGICMGACPVQIISFTDYSVDMLSAMLKAVEIPEGDPDTPRILVFACENDAYPALDMAGIQRRQYPASVRVIPVRCLGSVNSILIADAVSRGFDGVALLGCRAGEDYQCHFIRGSELLETRMGNVRETLGRLALEPERVQTLELAISDADRVPALLANLVDTLKAIGPNPMKGF
jgi:quinone-modifying oxidoreductase subunit QmoB